MIEKRPQTVFTLPPLPYGAAALEPVISERTLGFHHGKHHAGYVAALNKLVEGTGYAGLSLEDILERAGNDAESEAVFNNAAQAWNHTFYWACMKPGGGGLPDGGLADALTRDFGGISQFLEAFAKAATCHFGSGWCWLAADHQGKLEIVVTDNANTPLTQGKTPILVIDLWEHAYYLDHQNDRASYVTGWLDTLPNWDFAASNLPPSPTWDKKIALLGA
jgi:Fe-Mn family superoxide dismutase